MHIGVELMYDHGGTTHEYLTKRFSSLTVNESGRVVLKKYDRIMWRSEWMPHLEKFSEKSWQAFLSWSRTWKGVGLEEDALEQRGFQDGADLRLGAMHRLFEREKERERQTKKHHHNRVPKDRKERVRMHEKCMNIWYAKKNCIIGSIQSKPISTQFSTYKHTSKCMKHCENAHGMQCMII